MEIKKSIIIIKSGPRSMKGVESFLRNREWAVFSTADIKETISYIVQHRPQFVLIAVDHPVKKLRTLPKILKQSFPVCVIACIEGSTATSYNFLTSSEADYQINPPTTGPAVERVVQKFIRDQQEKVLPSYTGRHPEGGGKIDPGVIVMKGSASQGSSGMMTSSSGTPSKVVNEEALLAALEQDGPDSDSATPKTAGILQNGSGHSSHSVAQAGGSNPTGNLVPPSPGSRNDPSVDGPGSGPSAAGSSGTFSPSKTLESMILPMAAPPPPKLVGLEDFLPKPSNPKRPLVSRVACVVVESPKFTGYVVAAMGTQRTFDENLVTEIRARVFRYLDISASHQADVHSEVNIKQVDFQEWAMETAEFLRQSVHGTEELAVAFFPFKDGFKALGTSAAIDMGSVQIGDLHGDVAVEFNLYIYLAANRRYVLYTPKLSFFYTNQKDRLQKMGVTHLHIRRNEAQDLSKYRAQNYLNGKIVEYERKKSSAAA